MWLIILLILLDCPLFLVAELVFAAGCLAGCAVRVGLLLAAQSINFADYALHEAVSSC